MKHRFTKSVSVGLVVMSMTGTALAHPIAGMILHGKPMGGPTALAGTPLDGPPAGFPTDMMPVPEPGQHLTYVSAVLKPIDIVKKHEVFLDKPAVHMVVAVGRIGKSGVAVEADNAWFGLSAYLGTTNAQRNGTTVADRLINFKVYRTGKPGPTQIGGDFQLPGMRLAGDGSWNGVFIMDGHAYDTTIAFHTDKVVSRHTSGGPAGQTVVAFPDEVWNQK